jgi:hypothetical protein
MINRIIWVFREQRAGSTWFTTKLCQHTERQDYFFDGHTIYAKREFYLTRPQEKEDYKRILNTHNFFVMKSLFNYDNPIVIRITRKNKVEQIISNYVTSLTKHFNIEQKTQLTNFPVLDKFFIPLHKLDQLIRNLTYSESCWQEYAKHYENETVYYETLLQEYNSSLLNISNWSMNKNVDQPTLKLPYDKKSLIINYDEVENYIKKYF